MMTANNERNVILDISSDITVLGVILAVTQTVIYRAFGPGQAAVLVLFLAGASLWKLVSPFTETTSGRNTVLYATLLVVAMVLGSAVIMIF